MTPRQRVLSVLHGEMPDRVPFTSKDSLVCRGELEQRQDYEVVV